MFKIIKRNIEIIFVIVTLLALIAPITFTQGWAGINFTNTGAIGDTIGGLTSPFLTFLSIVLLYLTLKEQIEANKQQKEAELKDRDYVIITQLQSQIKSDLDSIAIIISSEGGKVYQGVRAIFKLSNLLKNKDISKYIDEAELRAFCLSITYLAHTIQLFLRKNFKSKIDKENKVSFFESVSKFEAPLIMLMEASGHYDKTLENKSESDKIIILLTNLKDSLVKEFDLNNPDLK